FRPVPVANVVAGAEEFMAGRVCCTINLVGSAAIRQANATISGGVHFLSISKAPDAVKRMQAIAPGSYVRTLPPAKPFVGVLAPTNFLAWDVLLITSKHVPDAVVYEVAKTLSTAKPNLVKIHPAFRGFNPKRMHQKGLEVPYHPGALKFYKEKGMQ
ncbi:MAG: TAXI family TRAP transporter solute-binding subunit, partial [Bauldia litoralis]